MDFQEIEIFIAPLKLYWIGMPHSPTIKSMEVELLKRDILVVDCTLRNIEECDYKDIQTKPAMLINLDLIFTREREKAKAYRYLSGLIERLKKLNIVHVIFHTTHIDHQIKQIINKRGYILLEKNLYDINQSIPIISQFAHKFHIGNDKSFRSYLRLQLKDQYQVRVNLQHLQFPDKSFTATLKDLSLSGLGVILTQEPDVTYFRTKSIVRAKIVFDRGVITINNAIVQRVDDKNHEVGLYFNLSDHNMINEHDANTISQIIYRIIRGLFDENGRLFDLNFKRLKLKN